jgi:SNF2 family DNA or RNA helicase
MDGQGSVLMVMIAIDESTTIKNHKAKRTKALMKIAANFKYRRLLTGSPVTKSPWISIPRRVP